MTVYRTTNGYDSRSEPEFVNLLNNICEKMNGNPNFPDEQNAAATLVSERNDFVKLAALASNGGREAILARDILKAKIVDQLHLLGNDVTASAKNDLLVLESSGFPIIKDRQPSAPLVKPVAPVVSAGVKVGQINCIAKKQTPRDSVTYWIGSDAADRSTWESFTKTTSKFVFENLTSGQRYHIQYELNGVRNQQVFSDVVTYISQ